MAENSKENLEKKAAKKGSAGKASAQKEVEEMNVAIAVEEKPATEITGADLLKAEIGEVKVRRAKGSKNIATGICNIFASFNNTMVNFSDSNGNTISWSSAGKCNFRGSRKSTAYAAQVVLQDAGRMAISHGLKEVHVKVKGPGLGRDAAIRALQALGLIVTGIVDVTPVPHNGCRRPKRRRV